MLTKHSQIIWIYETLFVNGGVASSDATLHLAPAKWLNFCLVSTWMEDIQRKSFSWKSEAFFPLVK